MMGAEAGTEARTIRTRLEDKTSMLSRLSGYTNKRVSVTQFGNILKRNTFRRCVV